MERRNVADNVIRRHHQQRVATTACRNRCERDGRCSVAADRFQDQRLRGRADLGKLLLDEIRVTRVRDHDRGGEAIPERAARGELQHRLVGGEREHLLGHFGA